MNLNSPMYNEIFSCIQENFQYPNLGKYMYLSETEKVNVSRNLMDQVYVNIAEKYNDIDFETIPASKGKISAMKEFADLQQSINLLVQISSNTNQSIPEIQTLATALKNMVSHQDDFYMGFVKNNPQIIMTYNLIALSLYCGTSLLIATMVDYINVANTDTVDMIIKKKYSKSNSYLMINSLDNFNGMCKGNAFTTFIQSAMRPQAMKEGALTISAIVVTSILALFKIIPVIKELIYVFFYSRMKLSEALAIQSNFIQTNVESLRMSGNPNFKTIRTQTWIADKLASLSSFFALKYEKSEKQINQDLSTKYTSNDVTLF